MAKRKKPARSAARAASSKADPFSKAQVAQTIRGYANAPATLLEWLDRYFPFIVGPRITYFEPTSGQPGTLVTIHGSQFSAVREENIVSVGNRPALVAAATTTELKVITAANVDDGPVKVTVGTHTAIGPQDFLVLGYPDAGAGEDGPPITFQGEGQGAQGDVNPIGTIRVLVALVTPNDLAPTAAARTTVTNAWSNVRDLLHPGELRPDGGAGRRDDQLEDDRQRQRGSAGRRQHRAGGARAGDGVRGAGRGRRGLRSRQLLDDGGRHVPERHVHPGVGRLVAAELPVQQRPAGRRPESYQHRSDRRPSDQPHRDPGDGELGPLRARVRPQHRVGAELHWRRHGDARRGRLRFGPRRSGRGDRAEASS